MNNPIYTLDALKKIVKKNLTILSRCFSLSEMESGYVYPIAFTKRISEEADSVLIFEMLENQYCLIPTYYPNKGFCILKTYQKAVDDKDVFQKKWDHLEVFDIFINTNNKIYFIHEKKEALQAFYADYLKGLHQLIISEEKKYFNSIKDKLPENIL
jgi:hypothetical protein